MAPLCPGETFPDKPMAFLFLDESFYEPLDLSALTGVLVYPTDYASIRDRMCRLVRDLQSATLPENTIENPIELHGRNLLPGFPEASKLKVHSEISAIINKLELRVFRVAYLNRKEIADAMPLDPKLYGLTFGGIQSALQPIMEHTLVVPVMDGIPSSSGARARIFSYSLTAKNWSPAKQCRHIARKYLRTPRRFVATCFIAGEGRSNSADD